MTHIIDAAQHPSREPFSTQVPSSDQSRFVMTSEERTPFLFSQAHDLTPQQKQTRDIKIDCGCLRSVQTALSHERLRFLRDLGYAGLGQTALLATVLSMSSARKILKADYAISPLSEGLIAASLPLGIAIGQIMIGKYSDTLGAKRTGQIAACISGAGALAASLQGFSVPRVIATSLLTGVGLGGESPTTNEMCKTVVNKASVSQILPLANSLGGVGEVLALTIISASSILPNELAWRTQMGLGAVLALLNLAARSALPDSNDNPIICNATPKELMTELVQQDAAEKGYGTATESGDRLTQDYSKTPIDPDEALSPHNQVTTTHQNTPPNSEKLLNSRWTPLVLSSASVCGLHDMVNNTLTAYSPEFLEGGSLFAVYTMACIASFATPHTLKSTEADSSHFRLTQLGRHAALARGLLINSSIYLGLSLSKEKLWQESGFGENKSLDFPSGWCQKVFTGLFVLQQAVFAAYTSAAIYSYPSETLPKHQTGNALGKVASTGKIGAIIGTLVMPLMREKYGFEAVLASCGAATLLASVITRAGMPRYDSQRTAAVQDNPEKLYDMLYPEHAFA